MSSEYRKGKVYIQGIPAGIITETFRSQIEESHLPDDRKEEMMDLMEKRMGRLAGNS